MNVGFDLSIAHINQAGTGIYARQLAATLPKVDRSITLHALAVKQSRDMSAKKTFQSRLHTLYRDLLWTHVELPLRARRAHLDLLHMPANVMPVTRFAPTVVSILDTTIFRTPEHFPVWHRNYARVFTPLAARRADLVLTISKQSKHDIVKQFGIPEDKVVVTPLAAAADFRPVPAADIAQVKQSYKLSQYILTVGTLEPRKNVARLLQAFSDICQRNDTIQLVHCGPAGWLYDDILLEVRRLGMQDRVKFLGRVPPADLVRLYNGAQVFVYPSLYEGFGLPVLEAMSCACPVVTSNISSLPEVADDAAILADPYDVAAIAAAIERVVGDQALADELRRKGLERAASYSWERCASETLAAYRQVLNR